MIKKIVFFSTVLLIGLTSIAQAEEGYSCEQRDDKEYCVDEKNKPYTGKIRKRNTNGSYISIKNYKQGYADGLATYFTHDGKLKERVYYKQGVKNGMDKLYYENRTIRATVRYKDGLLHGRQTFYTNDGKLLGRADYENGKILRAQCILNKENRIIKKDWSNEELKSVAENQLIRCED